MKTGRSRGLRERGVISSHREPHFDVAAAAFFVAWGLVMMSCHGGYEHYKRYEFREQTQGPRTCRRHWRQVRVVRVSLLQSGDMSQNRFIDLPVPGRANDIGSIVDVSMLSEGPTMVTSGPGNGDVILEISCDGGANFAPVTQSTIPNPPSKVLLSRTNRDIADPSSGRPTGTCGVIAQFARIRRLAGNGASTVSLGAPISTKNLFASLSLAPLSTSDMGPVKTICACGTYSGVVVVEGSVDGVNYDAVASFDTGHSDVRCIEGSYQSMRLRAGPAAPTGGVSIGAGFISAASEIEVLQFDSIRVVGERLEEFNTAGLPQGTIAYIGNDTYTGKNSVHDNYRLVYGENLSTAVLGTGVVNSPTFPVDGAQWIRLEIVNAQAAQKEFWSLDPANVTGVASDENTGWGSTMPEADASPLLTMAELVRRTKGANYAGTVVFHQLSDMTVASVPLDVSATDGNGYPVWMGKKVQVYPTDLNDTVTLTTYAPASPSANLGCQISVNSLPVSFTGSGLVGLFIESADGLRIAKVQKDLGSKTARITTPSNPNVVEYVPGTPQVFTSGEQVRFVSFPKLTCNPFKPHELYYIGISDVSLYPEPGSYVEYDFGSVIAFVARADLVGAYLKGSPTTSGVLFQCVGFSNSDVLFAGANWSTQYCGALNATLYVTSGANFIVSHAPWDMQASRLIFQNGYLNTYGPENSFATFDCPGVAVAPGGSNSSPGIPYRFNPNAPLYGSGNVGYIVALLAGTVAYMPFLANCFATTAQAKPLLLGTVPKDYADMPVVDLTNLTAMIQG